VDGVQKVVSRPSADYFVVGRRQKSGKVRTHPTNLNAFRAQMHKILLIGYELLQNGQFAVILLQLSDNKSLWRRATTQLLNY
jgi:hypothetical protein